MCHGEWHDTMFGPNLGFEIRDCVSVHRGSVTYECHEGPGTLNSPFSPMYLHKIHNNNMLSNTRWRDWWEGRKEVPDTLGPSRCTFCAEAGCRLCRWLRYPANRSALLSKCQRRVADLNAHPLSAPIQGRRRSRSAPVSELAQIDLLGPCAFR